VEALLRKVVVIIETGVEIERKRGYVYYVYKLVGVKGSPVE